jgi:hypothetical protein
MHSPYLAATLMTMVTRDRIEAATSRSAAKRARNELGTTRTRGADAGHTRLSVLDPRLR